MNSRTASVMAPMLVGAALLTAIGTLIERPSHRSPTVLSEPPRVSSPALQESVASPAPPAGQSVSDGSSPPTTVGAGATVATAATPFGGSTPTAPADADPSVPLAPSAASGGAPVRVTLPPTGTNRPPDCSAVAASTSILWPSNHELETVVVSGATDPDGQPVSLAVTSITQDEPVDGTSDGNTSPDAAMTASPTEVLVRAERSGKGDGRVYELAFAATDAGGGTCQGVASVGVPLKKNGVPEHSGEEFNSLVP